MSERESAVAVEQERGSSRVVGELGSDRIGEGIDTAPAAVSTQKLGAALPESFQGQSAVVEPTGDRLVLYRSDRVSAETLEVRGQGREQYLVRFWMHTAKESEGGDGALGGSVSVPARRRDDAI